MVEFKVTIDGVDYDNFADAQEALRNYWTSWKRANAAKPEADTLPDAT